MDDYVSFDAGDRDAQSRVPDETKDASRRIRRPKPIVTIEFNKKAPCSPKAKWLLGTLDKHFADSMVLLAIYVDKKDFMAVTVDEQTIWRIDAGQGFEEPTPRQIQSIFDKFGGESTLSADEEMVFSELHAAHVAGCKKHERTRDLTLGNFFVDCISCSSLFKR